MIRLILSFILVLFLAGCATTEPVVKVVVKTEYVVRTASAEQKRLPPYPEPINVLMATQIDLAEWIKANEKRQRELETMMQELVKFYEKPIPASAPASGASK